MASLYLGNSSSVLLKTSAKYHILGMKSEIKKANEIQIMKDKYGRNTAWKFRKKRSGKSNTANYRDEAQAGKD